MLSKDQIKAIKDIRTEKVMVPEWEEDEAKKADAFLLVRGLAGVERDEFESSMMESRKKGVKMNLTNMRAKLIVKSVVDEDGNPYFSERDLEWLGRKSAAPLDRLYSVAAQLSGISDADMEELEKNCGRIPLEDSASE